MNTALIIIIVVLVVLVLAFISVYNGLLRKKIYVQESWSSIDVQLKRKANVLPNLVDTLKMQTDYEGTLLRDITDARSGITEGSNAERMKANDNLTNSLLPSINAVMENYPTLGASESFRQLMTEISDCENKIAYARNRYNISVTTFNTAIITFPGVIFAGMMKLTAFPFFAVTEEQRQDADDMRIKDIK